jgi:hypothetical protein
MKSALSLIASVSLLAFTSGAGAQESVRLTDVQMDSVTAGATVVLLGTATSASAGAALANALGAVVSLTNALADPLGITTAGVPTAAATASNTAAATSVFGPGLLVPSAAAMSRATATAALQ